MENRIKRFLVLLATAVLLVSMMTIAAFAQTAEPVCYEHGDVNGDGVVEVGDAIYTLYHSVYGDDFPVNQTCDFTDDGNVNLEDALYLLWASMDDFFEDSEYTLEGTIHGYYAPVWTWDADAADASVSFRCACGEGNQTLNANNGVVVTSQQTAEATCVAAGALECEAKVTFCEQEYSSKKTLVIPAKGQHNMSGTPNCTTGAVCLDCGFERAALGHVLVLDAEASTAATCTASAVQVYTCTACDYSESVTLAGELAHTWKYREGQDEEYDGCVFVRTYECTACGEVKEGEGENDTYTKHSITTALTSEATCSETGLKTHYCPNCTYQQSEVIPVNDSHAWNDGVTADGITTYTCTDCGQTKTTVSAENGAAVDKAALDAVQELQLDKDTAIRMDTDTKAQFAEDDQIAVSVGTVDLDETNLSAEEKAQVGDNTVYNFELTVNGETISDFAGSVTVTLPYELQEDEDINSIDVWYIADDGKLERMDATYSNGYVTFTTDHFSYYTVTRLTPTERCARYGHSMVEKTKAVTCTEDGYTMSMCQRCGYVESRTEYPMTGHTYLDTDNAKAPTCTEAGYTERKCACGHVITGTLPATGHNMVHDENSSADASCSAPGKKVQKCANDGCDQTLEEILPQLSHTFLPFETKDADCVSGGYQTGKCMYCGVVETLSETAALGHTFQVDAAVWTWNENHSEATVTLTCANDAAHTQTLNAVVTEKLTKATCEAEGSVVYTATASFNKVTFTDTYTETIAATGHKPAAQWETSASGHYHVCSVCGARVATADHVFGAGVITKAPTCVASGKEAVVCTVCGFETEKTVPATGEHNFVNKICTVCGYEDGTCDHLRKHRVPVDLSGYDICEGAWANIVTCECGERAYLEYSISCEHEEDGYEKEITLEDGTKVLAWCNVCSNCDLVIMHANYEEVDREACKLRSMYYEWFEYDGTMIAKAKGEEEMARNHPLNIENAKVVHLSDYGLCGMDVWLGKCYCGENTGYEIPDDSWDCEWEWNEDDDSQTCLTCGALWTQDYSEDYEEGRCYNGYSNVNNIYLNDALVYTFRSDGTWEWHDYATAAYELDGESCEDGVLVTNVCVNCGKEEKTYILDHHTIISERVDLSGTGMCNDYAWVYRCPCGRNHDGFLSSSEDNYCEWSGEYTENGRIFECVKCGTVWTETRTVQDKDENCWGLIRETNTYTAPDGSLIFTYDRIYEGEDHNVVRVLEALGEDCEKNGVRVTEKCTDCGDVIHVSVNYEHMGQVIQRFDLSSLDMCIEEARIYACPCGKNQWFSYSDDSDYCQLEWVDSDENGYTERCSKCGTTMHVAMEHLEKVDPCHVNCLYTRTFTQEGKEPVTITHNQVDLMHGARRFTLELLEGAEDCEDGYRVHMTCDICGAEEDHGIHYGHSGWETDRQTLYTGDQLCGKAELVSYACACGEQSWKTIEWIDGRCEFEYTYDDPETGLEYFTCANCGAVRTRQYSRTPIEGETCKMAATNTFVYYQNDVELFRYEEQNISYEHRNIYTFNMLGQTCEEGYTLNFECILCGETGAYSDVHTSCEPWTVEIERLYEGEGVCGEILLSRRVSPCGKKTEWYADDACNWAYLRWDGETGTDYYECRSCGVQKAERNVGEKIPGTCSANRTMEVTYTLNGTVIATATREYVSESHETVASFELLGQTCEDGYYITHTCVDCGLSTRDGWTHTGHAVWRTGKYDLTDYGMCPGYVYTERCACGQNSSAWYDMTCECPAGRSIEEDEELGIECNYCINCNTMFRRGEVGEINKDTCWYNGTFYFKVYDENNNYKLDLEAPVSHEGHVMNTLSLELMDPNGNCENGYIHTSKCVNCGKITTERGYGHYVTAVKHIDLAQYGACGGYVDYNSCACGQYSDVFHNFACADMYSNEQYWHEEVDGIEHEKSTRSCADCGLTYSTDRYEVPTEDPCYKTVHYNKTYQLGDVLNETFYQTWEDESHDAVDWFVMLPDSETCEDGVEHWRRCKVCGKEYREGVNYYHAQTVVDSIDLTAYGSVCGAQLNHYACACGAEERYDIDEDSLCQLEQKWVENWVEDALNDHQMTTDGGWNYSSDAYTFTCAVTDPDCDLSIRMSECWLKEGCMAVEYQIWQLGYDAATGTCQEELKIPTGEQRAYHNYEVVHSYETTEGGTDVEIDTYTCVDCGSTYVRKDYFIDSYQAKVTEDFVNTLWEENGEPRERHYVIELYELHNGYRFETMSRTDMIYADGSTWWEQNSYTYNFDNGCSCVRTYTNSNGANWSEDREAHQRYQHDEWIKEPTCTQYGILRRYWECPACETLLEERHDQIDPYAHDWNWDDGKQTYVCSRCSLENSNGASGEIVLEDLTEKHGTGTNTVIGYWIRENVEYSVVFSVILEDMEGDNERFLDVGWALWSVEENGVNALVFDTASAQTEAEAKIAEAGYTGSYAIRVALVPVGSGNSLDYAITFDSQTAA